MWVAFALCTVLTWGLYGAFLNRGATEFEHDRMKAFLFVGVAYFLIAILGPLIMILLYGKEPKWEFKSAGIMWSLIAGSVGAIGALTVLFALSNNPMKGPAAASQVMSLVFAGAPVVAAVYGLIIKPPKDGLGSLDWKFVAGLVMAAAGGCLVTLFKPG